MHIYEKDGIKVPSVTTVLSAIFRDDSIALWANSLGYKHKDYKTELEKYAAFGTIAHGIMEHYMMNDRPAPTVPFEYISKINHILANVDKTLPKMGLSKECTEKAEETIISTEMGFGGTIDWLGMSNGEYVLIDYKTSNRFKSHHFIQLSAYAYLLEKELGIKISKAYILLLREDKCRYRGWTYEDLLPFREIFMKALELYQMSAKTGCILEE